MKKKDFKELEDKIIIGKKLLKSNKNIVTNLSKLKNYNNAELDNHISYELQAGSYIKNTYRSKDNSGSWTKKKKYTNELFNNMQNYIKNNQTFLEVGVGECVTMLPLLKKIKSKFKCKFFGFDFSLSRIIYAKKFLKRNKVNASLFNANLDSIPLDNNSIDIVYSSHSIEPNRGKEKTIIEEMLRVSKKYIFLFEPIYELNPKKNRKRMEKFNYIKNLKKTCEKLDCKILKYELLNFSEQNHNLTGVIILEKKNIKRRSNSKHFTCPITKNKLDFQDNYLINKKFGIIYPIIKEIPVLTPSKYILNLIN